MFQDLPLDEVSQPSDKKDDLRPITGNFTDKDKFAIDVERNIIVLNVPGSDYRSKLMHKTPLHVYYQNQEDQKKREEEALKPQKASPLVKRDIQLKIQIPPKEYLDVPEKITKRIERKQFKFQVTPVSKSPHNKKKGQRWEREQDISMKQDIKFGIHENDDTPASMCNECLRSNCNGYLLHGKCNCYTLYYFWSPYDWSPIEDDYYDFYSSRSNYSN